MIPDQTIYSVCVKSTCLPQRTTGDIKQNATHYHSKSREYQYLCHADCILQQHVTTDSSTVRIKKLDNTNGQTNKTKCNMKDVYHSIQAAQLNIFTRCGDVVWLWSCLPVPWLPLPPLGWILRIQPGVLNKVLHIIFMPCLVPVLSHSQLIIDDWLVFVWFYGEWFLFCEKVLFYCSWKRTDCWVS